MSMVGVSIRTFLRERPAAKRLVRDLEEEHGETPFSGATLERIAQRNGILHETSIIALGPLSARYTTPQYIVVPPFAYAENMAHELCHIMLDTENELTCEYFSAIITKTAVPKMLWKSVTGAADHITAFCRRHDVAERVAIGEREMLRIARSGIPGDTALLLAEEYADAVIPQGVRESAVKRYRWISGTDSAYR